MHVGRVRSMCLITGLPFMTMAGALALTKDGLLSVCRELVPSTSCYNRVYEYGYLDFCSTSP